MLYLWLHSVYSFILSNVILFVAYATYIVPATEAYSEHMRWMKVVMFLFSEIRQTVHWEFFLFYMILFILLNHYYLSDDITVITYLSPICSLHYIASSLSNEWHLVQFNMNRTSWLSLGKLQSCWGCGRVCDGINKKPAKQKALSLNPAKQV